MAIALFQQNLQKELAEAPKIETPPTDKVIVIFTTIFVPSTFVAVSLFIHNIPVTSQLIVNRPS